MWTEPQFDKHAFAGKRTKAVSATKTPAGWDTPGISFGDFSTMHIQRREKVKERRLPRPDWVSDNDVIQGVVLNAAERRLYLPHDGPTNDRRDRIKAESDRRLPSLKEKLHRAQFRFHEAAQSGASPDRLQRLAIQVGGADTEIIMLERGLVGMMVAVLYMYYNLGYTSVGVAEELGIKPPAVRMLLYTLHRAYARLQGADPTIGNRCVRADSRYVSEWPDEKVRLMFLLRTNGKGWAQIGKTLKASQQSVKNHWRKYFGDMNVGRHHKTRQGARIRLSDEERQARIDAIRQERAAKSKERQAEKAAERQKRVEQIVELRKTLTLRGVAEKLGVSMGCVQHYLTGIKVEREPRVRVLRVPRVRRARAVVYYVKRAGYDAKLVNPGKTCWTPANLKKLAELWNSGKDVHECAKVLGAPRNGVYYALRRILKRKL
jgi:hypothetical protein